MYQLQERRSLHQTWKVAVMKSVPIKLSKVEYVVGMVPKGRITSADMKDVPTLLSKEEFVSDALKKPKSLLTKDDTLLFDTKYS